MTVMNTLLSPLPLLFLLISIGLAVGRVRIGRVSVGIAGVLFVAILAGFLIRLLPSEADAKQLTEGQNAMQTYAGLGSALFVSVIGLETGLSIRNHAANAMAAFFIGAAMSASGALLMRLISALDPSVSLPSLLGILCGALTSTPGLTDVCERLGEASADAVLGYGCAYLPGVTLTVLSAQLFTRKQPSSRACTIEATGSGDRIGATLILIGATAALGHLLGTIRVSCRRIFIGSTAGSLSAGLLLGALFRRGDAAHEQRVSDICRTIGLVLFFAGTGFTTGVRMPGFRPKAILYGILMTLTAVFCGALLCRMIPSARRPSAGFLVAGGMTSSPAYGVLAPMADKEDIGCFSFAYFGALLSLTAALQIIVPR